MDISKYYREVLEFINQVELQQKQFSTRKEIMEESLHSNYIKRRNNAVYMNTNDVVDEKHTKANWQLKQGIMVDIAVLTVSEEVNFLLHSFHRHNYYELAYVYQGMYQHVVNGEQMKFFQKEACLLNPYSIHRELTAPKGSFVILLGIPISTLHKIIKAKNTQYPNRQILSAFANNVDKGSAQRKESISFRFSSQEDAVWMDLFIEHIVEEYNEMKIGWQELVNGYTMRLLHHMFMTTEMTLQSCDNDVFINKRFQEMDTYLCEHLSNVTRQEVADNFHFSSDYVNTLFKKVTGFTFSDYLLEKRLIEAGRMLKETTLSVQEIIYQIGYSNRSYFFRKFVEHYGMTPQVYRNMRS